MIGVRASSSVGALLVFGAVVGGWGGVAGATALDDYVAANAPSYTWSYHSTITGPGYTVDVIDLTSQTWRDANEVDRPLWQHWVHVIKPDTVTSSTAMLWVGSHANGATPNPVDFESVNVALQTNSVVVDVSQIPNQRLKFTGEADPRYIASGREEDELLSYTWDQYLQTGDEFWPGQLPMTKSVVRAMDMAQEYLASPQGGGINIDDFVVSGASKRGWTTWLTAAVDPRVKAIIPIVIDLLNIQSSFEHHWDAYGFWAPAIEDYVDMGIPDRIGTPQFRSLLELVDPYEYRERFTMPKFLVNSAGDDFFVPDSSQFYYDDLLGPKYLRYVPNTDHSLDDVYANDSVIAFYEAILSGAELPEYSWEVEAENRIRVQTDPCDPRLMGVKLWEATNTEARDFRKNNTDAVYVSSALTDEGGGVYVGEVNEPASGWTAFFVELTYDSGWAIPYTFTTQVSVAGPGLPFAADLDWDTSVGALDSALFVASYTVTDPGEANFRLADIDLDGDHNFLDTLQFINAFALGAGAMQVPEPGGVAFAVASVSAMGLGRVFGRWRRRRG